MPNTGGGLTANAGFPTDQITVLDAVVARIQSHVPLLKGDNTVFLSLTTDPIQSERQNIYATVAPMGGQYDEGLFTGIGIAAEDTGCIVTVFTQMRLDRSDEATKLLTDNQRGLLLIKKQLLACLTNYMLQDANSNNILRRPMRPINAGHPQKESEKQGSFSLAFTTDFTWSLGFPGGF